MRNGCAAHKNIEAPRSIETNLKCVPPWRRGRPKAGIDCPEGAELCRMVKRTYGITGKRSDTDEVNPATMDCASSRHSILSLWRGPSPRACSAEKNHAVRKPNPQFLPTHFCFQTSRFSVVVAAPPQIYILQRSCHHNLEPANLNLEPISSLFTCLSGSCSFRSTCPSLP